MIMVCMYKLWCITVLQLQIVSLEKCVGKVLKNSKKEGLGLTYNLFVEKPLKLQSYKHLSLSYALHISTSTLCEGPT